MSVRTVSVKWEKNKYDVEVDITKPGEIFKMQISSLTLIPLDRIKLLYKGKKIEDNTDLSALNIPNKAAFMCIGSAEEAPEATKVEFIEDMTLAKKKVLGLEAIPLGLSNIGNTCYFNSIIQSLYAIPELKGALELF
jgi:ubiquitin carboxyl-terminal hydrolase 14